MSKQKKKVEEFLRCEAYNKQTCTHIRTDARKHINTYTKYMMTFELCVYFSRPFDGYGRVAIGCCCFYCLFFCFPCVFVLQRISAKSQKQKKSKRPQNAQESQTKQTSWNRERTRDTLQTNTRTHILSHRIFSVVFVRAVINAKA